MCYYFIKQSKLGNYMAASETPKYDNLHPVIQDRIDSIIEISQRLETGSYTPSPKDKKLKEFYAGIPKEELYDILKNARKILIEQKLDAHIAAHAR